MMDPHLTERALEALAHDRPDLVSAAERGHLQQCDECQAGVADLRGMSSDLSLAMRAEPALDFDLDAMVSAALLSNALLSNATDSAFELEAAPLAAREAVREPARVRQPAQ